MIYLVMLLLRVCYEVMLRCYVFSDFEMIVSNKVLEGDN